jgi:predicted nucleic acid-binding protein
MIVISDTSPLIHLAACNQLLLLQLLYGNIIIPRSVEEEIKIKGKDENIKRQISDADWIISKSALDKKLVSEQYEKLDGAEAEAIVLSIELNADMLLIDERKGRAIAKQFHIKTGGVLSVLIEAKEQKLIPAVKPLIMQMIQRTGFRISQELMDEVWKIAGE